MENNYVCCDCPYCGCGAWTIKPKADNITGHSIVFDDDKQWIVAVCEDCDGEFEVEYKAVKISTDNPELKKPQMNNKTSIKRTQKRCPDCGSELSKLACGSFHCSNMHCMFVVKK